MKRLLTYQITREDFPSIGKYKIQSFLKAKGYSSQILKILKQQAGAVLLNGAPSYLNVSLKAEDTLQVLISEEESSEHIVPVNLPLEIVYEDEDLFVLNKPAGMPIHPSQNNYENSLANALAYHCKQLGEPFVFRCINRLDRDTSGLTIVAKHMLSAGILGRDVAAKSHSASSAASAASADDCTPLKREYLAIVRGTVTPSAGTINAPLSRKPGSIIERCVDYENGESAVTHYRVLEEKNGHSLLSLTLETGRTHQIRIHMKHLGHPLIGDYLYNPDMESINRQALHSYRLSFRHPITGEMLEFTAPLPEDMENVLRSN